MWLLVFLIDLTGPVLLEHNGDVPFFGISGYWLVVSWSSKVIELMPFKVLDNIRLSSCSGLPRVFLGKLLLLQIYNFLRVVIDVLVRCCLWCNIWLNMASIARQLGRKWFECEVPTNPQVRALGDQTQPRRG